MVDLIKPSDLAAAATVFPDDAMVVDAGGVVRRATPLQVVDAGAPAASEAVAIAGVNNTLRMTPLRTKQVLDNVTAPSVLRAAAWAESSTPPDPTNPDSKSSKGWAEDAEASAERAALFGVRQVRDAADFFSLSTTDVGYRYSSQNGMSWDIVTSGGMFNHPVTGRPVRVVSGGPIAYGAKGDGVSDDSPAFRIMENARVNEVVDLGGFTYLIQSLWASPSTGVRLQLDYTNGALLVDGRPLVMNRTRGASLSNPVVPPQTPRSVGLLRASENAYRVYSPVVGGYWVDLEVNRDAAGLPFNWRGGSVRQIMGIMAQADSGHVFVGDWASDIGVTYNLTSASATSYVGGRAKQAIKSGEKVTITYQGGGDVFVMFVGRNTGAYVNVTLNGGSDGLILPRDVNGNSYFDSYTAVDLSQRQLVQIASGLSNTTHTIELEVSTLRNPANTTGFRYIHNALVFNSTEMGPWSPQTDAPQWRSGEVILPFQVRLHGGRAYYAATGGTCGPTPPTQTSGTASDGGVDWTWRDASGFLLGSHRWQAAGSQNEYAYWVKPAGATDFEDVGGALHGNETQISHIWTVSGTPVDLPIGGWASGSDICCVEVNQATHTQVGGGATPIAKTTLTRKWFPGGVWTLNPVREMLNFGGEIANDYPTGMCAALHYAVDGYRMGFNSFYSPCDGWRSFPDYYGQSNPIVGRTADFIMAAEGPCMQPAGSGGVPTSLPAPLTMRLTVQVDPAAVEMYKFSETFAGKAMNIAGRSNAGGFESYPFKFYFQRSSPGSITSYSAGDVIEGGSRYTFNLSPRVQ